MPLVNMKDMVDHAYRHNYAVGAFDLVNLEFLQGVMAAAERCRAPVILSLGESHLESIDFDLLISAAGCAAQRASVPVAILFHHGGDLSSAVHAINAGCNGVMVGASSKDLGQLIATTGEVVAMAHACGVPVEGAIGHVSQGGSDASKTDRPELLYTSVAEARGYVDRTGVDFLAVSIGTVRGHTKSKLDWQRLKQINEALDVPLSIYDGTGLSNGQFRRLIENGVAKINYFTGLAEAAFEQLRSSVKSLGRDSYTSATGAVQHAVDQEAERCLRIWGAAGRAAEVLEQCCHWTPVEHVVTHEVDGTADGGLQALMDECRRVLRTIPGVREVCSGKVVQEGRLARCNWLVRFCHPAAAESYRGHPAYIEFLRKPRSRVVLRAASDRQLAARGRGGSDSRGAGRGRVSQPQRN